LNEKRKSRFYNFSRKFTKKLGKKKDQTTQSEKVKKESDKKLKERTASMPETKPVINEIKPDLTSSPVVDETNNNNNNIEKRSSSLKNNSQNHPKLQRSKSINFLDPKKLHLIYRQYQQEKQEKVGVPILTTMAIILFYLIFGMFIFSSFEGKSSN